MQTCLFALKNADREDVPVVQGGNFLQKEGIVERVKCRSYRFSGSGRKIVTRHQFIAVLSIRQTEGMIM